MSHPRMSIPPNASRLSAKAMEHFLNPRNAGPLPNPSGEGWAGSTATSRYMRIQVRLEDGRIRKIGFGTYGCAPAIAAASVLTEWSAGRTVEEARAYTPQRLLRALGGLPEARRYCAALAVEALHAALDDALQPRPSSDVQSPINRDELASASASLEE
jgi:NifU-like protein